MQKITVKEVKEVKTKTGTVFYAVVDDTGAEFTTYDTKMKEVTSGSMLEIEPKVKGKYVNISDGWKVIAAGAAAEAPPAPTNQQIVKPEKQWQPRGDSPEQRRSIERQVAAKLAIEFYANITTRAYGILGQATSETSVLRPIAEVLADAETIYQWISGTGVPNPYKRSITY